MPELAEVAVYARDISDKINGSKLTKVESYGDNKRIVPARAIQFFQGLIGHKVYCLSMAKSLIFTDFSNLAEFKLGMTGGFSIDQPKNHIYWKFVFDNGVILYHTDPRGFGSVTARKCRSQDFEMAIGGFYAGKFQLFSKYKKHLKESEAPRISWLLSKGPITGVGNYMANEALGALSLNPFVPFTSIREMIIALEECKKVAMESFKLNGYSFGGGYYTISGQKGKFQGKFYKSELLKKQSFRGRPVYSKYSMEDYEQ